jgi:predicted nucleic acid-binding protein
VKTYVDTSVLLRIVLQEPYPLPEWPQIQIGLSSALLRVECCRALDRLLRDGKIADEQYDARLTEIDEMLAQMLVLPITPRSCVSPASDLACASTRLTPFISRPRRNTARHT